MTTLPQEETSALRHTDVENSPIVKKPRRTKPKLIAAVLLGLVVSALVGFQILHRLRDGSTGQRDEFVGVRLEDAPRTIRSGTLNFFAQFDTVPEPDPKRQPMDGVLKAVLVVGGSLALSILTAWIVALYIQRGFAAPRQGTSEQSPPRWQLRKATIALAVAFSVIAGLPAVWIWHTRDSAREKSQTFTFEEALLDVPATQAPAPRSEFEELKAKAESGDANAQSSLGACYALGDGVPQDTAEAAKWYRKAADQGHANAQYNLGVAYGEGNGVPQDTAEAAKWYRMAANQEHASAQYNLGFCHSNGEGVPKDFAEAVKWYRKAANQAHADAQCNLGRCYDKGEGLPQNHPEAVKWYRKAADQSNVGAQFNLGLSYKIGRGAPQDYAESAKWFRKAADQGLADAQFSLGACYHKGEGLPQNHPEAVKWYRKAADQGNARAQCNLGVCYYLGEGVPQNDLEAYFWFSLSAAQGANEAPRNRDGVAKRMSREEIVEGQRRATAFLAKKSSPSQTGGFRSEAMPSPAGNQPRASGTGYFVTDDGYLVSNSHVVAEAVRVMVQTKAGLVPAQVVKTDAANDLALLKVSGTSSGLPVISSRAVKLGSTVATVGFPNIGLQGFAPKLAKGEIGALTGAQDDPRYFQISVPVQPGNSGGALVDERGNVVGVVSAKLSARAALSTSGALPENVNYAVKSSFLLSFLESVPEVAAKLKEPNAKDRKFEDVVKSAEEAAVLVLVY